MKIFKTKVIAIGEDKVEPDGKEEAWVDCWISVDKIVMVEKVMNGIDYIVTLENGQTIQVQTNPFGK